MVFGNLLLREKQARMLLALKDQSQNWYISSVAKAAGTTYVHACNFLIDCERLGIIKSEKHGRIKNIKLTDRGAQIADSISSIYASMSVKGDDAGSAVKQKAEEKKPA